MHHAFLEMSLFTFLWGNERKKEEEEEKKKEEKDKGKERVGEWGQKKWIDETKLVKTEKC